MNDKSVMLVAEFENQHTAETAVHALKAEGIDLADVRIHGRNYAYMTDPEGSRTVSQAAILGAQIGMACAFLGTLMIELDTLIIHSAVKSQGGLPFLPVLGVTLLIGMLVGGSLGSIYGTVAHSADAPESVVSAYGDDLEKGMQLLTVTGNLQLLETARAVLEEARPLSMGLQSLSHA